MKIETANRLRGTVTVPGDKSISHRAVMFGSIARGTTEITNFLQGADCLATIDCFRQMGVDIENRPDKIIVHGNGLHGLKEPAKRLYMGNSGTTTRLISGILSGQTFPVTLSGDDSLNTRPMGRIIDPLTQMGARIESIAGDGCAPLRIEGSRLHGIHYQSKVASAQVKSAILLAGLYADSKTSVTEPALSRNHTELMLKGFGAQVECQDTTASVLPCNELYGQNVNVPGDISSAAYFIAAALLTPDSEILLENVGINPTRAGFLEVCENMGADITYMNRRESGGEPVCDLLVRSKKLIGTVIEGDLIPTLIDEIPMIAVMAALADGTTIIKDAAELKVKETDRILTITENLAAMGADITPTGDGMIIKGGPSLHGTQINSYMDHRIAMAFSIAGLAADGVTTIKDSECVDVSYPGFYDTLRSLHE